MKKDFPSNKEFRKTASGGALFGETIVHRRAGWDETNDRVRRRVWRLRWRWNQNGIAKLRVGENSESISSRARSAKKFTVNEETHKENRVASGPGGYVSTVDSGFSNEPFRGQIDSVSNRVAKKVLTETYDGVEPKVVYEGGSIPVMRMIQKYISIEPALMAFSTKDNMYHAPNEYYSIDQFKTATRSYVRVLAEVSEFEKKAALSLS